ncbi:ABC transporter substrate-binding protein [Phytohabitans houttuyneae]|uniref:ABC transporter substrate-binding protein n=1 Tax=Phytohabitans houttuyneae TaxID=1076126 RepID=UPI001FE2D29B|nr:ABC transporter substrate-binding protein [Phytohabitans houttuyneae]
MAGACSETTDDGPSADQQRTATGVIATDPKDSLGPAPEVPGATKGGTFTIIREVKISHLDPQRVYSFAGLMNAPLYARTLTTWKDDGKGNLTLVGDLAQTPGTNVNNDCKVWEFKVKDGVKFEDGSAITAKEIAYGIARSFDPDLTGGPTYVQEWLADTADYDTKWDFKANKTSLPPGLTTPDDKTIRFEFAKAHCDLPFALSLPASAPLPPAKDTGVNLDNQPFSSGPYKITKHTPGVEIVLERNEHWDAATDPVRHQYPDKFVWTFGPDPDAGANRVIADSGPDQSALAFNGVPSALVSQVANNAALKERSIISPTPTAWRLSINTQRVTDLAVRQALNYGIDRDGFIKSIGGETVASPITTLMPPATIGYQKYDAYPAGPNGNPEKAKELLAGKTPSWYSAWATTPSRRARSSRATWRRPASRSRSRRFRPTPSSTRPRRRTTPGTCTWTRGPRTGRAEPPSCPCSSTAGRSRLRATATRRTSTTTPSTPSSTACSRSTRPRRRPSGPSWTSAS